MRSKKVTTGLVGKNDKRVVIEVHMRDGHHMSWENSSYKYSHTAYIEFRKEDFPNVKYPKIVKDEVLGPRFDYMRGNDLAELDFHGGITFYEETKYLENEMVLVKAGCDYQHLYDDDWAREDNTDIIMGHITVVAEEFLEKFGGDSK